MRCIMELTLTILAPKSPPPASCWSWGMEEMVENADFREVGTRRQEREGQENEDRGEVGVRGAGTGPDASLGGERRTQESRRLGPMQRSQA